MPMIQLTIEQIIWIVISWKIFPIAHRHEKDVSLILDFSYNTEDKNWYERTACLYYKKGN